jgi:hypothetical protein
VAIRPRLVKYRRADALREVTRFHAPGDLLGGPAVGEVLPVLVGTDPEAFLDNRPDLARPVIDWVDQHRKLGSFRSQRLATPFVALKQRREAVWREKARRLSRGHADSTYEHPHIYRLAAALARDRLVRAMATAALDCPAGQTSPRSSGRSSATTAPAAPSTSSSTGPTSAGATGAASPANG